MTKRTEQTHEYKNATHHLRKGVLLDLIEHNH